MDVSRVCEEAPVTSIATAETTVDAVSLTGVFDELAAPRIAWFGADRTYVAGGAVTTVQADGPKQLTQVRQQANAVFSEGDSSQLESIPLLGGIRFGPSDATTPDWQGFPSAWFILPEVLAVEGDEDTRLVAVGAEQASAQRRLEQFKQTAMTAVEPASDPPGVKTTARRGSRSDWCQTVADVTDRLDAGALEKVVLAQTLEATLEAPLDPGGALAQLSTAYPRCYRFAMQPSPDAGTFIGASPEQLVATDGATIRTEALAGSASRNAEADLDTDLQADPKTDREHGYVLETIRDRLRPHTASIEIAGTGLRQLKTLEHRRTPITATPAGDVHVLSLVEALHPTPAVGGHPTDQARTLIERIEDFDRGWYAGPVGWFDAAGRGHFAVGIRSMLIRDQQAHLFAGAGIVAESDPKTEYDEIGLKYQPMLDVLQ